MSDLRSLTQTISVDLLNIMLRSGVKWGIVYRRGGTLEEAQAYAWGNTLVFDVYAPVFLLAMTEGYYVNDQLGRYASGLWSFAMLDNLDDLESKTQQALESVGAYD